MGDEDLEEIAKLCSVVSVRAREHVFHECEECRGVWVIARGRVRLYHTDVQGRQQVVSFRGPHDTVDLAPAFDGRPHTANALAMEDCELVLVPRTVLACLLERYPAMVRNAIEALCIEVRQRDISVAVASLRDARGRVGCTLLQTARQYGAPGAGGTIRIDYRLTRQDIADRAGTTVETAIRVMSELQQRGAIQTTAQQIDLLDVGYIREMIGCADCQFECSMFAPVVIPPSSI